MKPQTRLVLSFLRSNPDGITQRETYAWGAGMRLSGRILELREAGYSIETTWETFGTARYARYVLHEDRWPTVRPLSLTEEHHLNALEKRRMLRDDVLYLNDPRNPDAWTPDELVMIANQSGIEVSRG